MQERLTLPDLLAQTREVSHLFDRCVGHWTPTTMMSELAAEVGTLADSIMIEEQHRPPRIGEQIDLADDVVDVLFMLFRIADHYHIDLQVANHHMLTSTRRKLEQSLVDYEDDALVLIKPSTRDDLQEREAT